ncbi:MAG: ATP-binding protein [Sedimentisphaerales bacterium]
MTINREKKGRFKKLFVSVFLYAIPFVIVFFAIFAIVNAQEKIWKNNLNKELQMHIHSETTGIENRLGRVVQDISFLADTIEASEIFNNSSERAYSNLTELFARFGYARRVYAQLRILDTGGRETVRVDFKNGKATICPENKLQDKSGRPYFTDSVVLDKGLIYISKLNLNVENEKIEIPYNPMIRFATPVFDRSGTKKGVLVLNYMASALIAIVKDHSKSSFDTNIKSQFLNQDGYWLYTPEQEKCWGFMFDDKKNYSMPAENPELWKKIKNSQNGIIANKQGLFAYNTVYQTETASRRLGVENIPDAKAEIQEHYWKIVSYIPNDYIAAYEHKSNAILFLLFGTIGVIIALIERKLISAHKQLLQKQKNLEIIFNASPVGMLLLNEKAEITKINGFVEKLVGNYHLGDQPGNLLGCIHSFENPKGCGYSSSCPKCPIRNAIKTVLQKNESVRCAEVLSTFLIDGEKTDLWLEVNAEQIILDGKRCAVVAMNNITDRKKAVEEMKEAVEMKSKFISTASHELRTPLTSIKEGVNLVYSETTGPLNDDQKEFLGIAKRNVDRLARLINDVLDYQKMSAGRMTFNLKSASINEAVKAVEETMRPLTKEKGLDFIIELDDAVPLVNFDKDKIIQVLTNLVNNAIKFTETGSVKISTSRTDDKVITAVKDTGGGIKQEDISKLFQEFSQLVTKDAERKVGGTGLGLVISKKIVESHGGRIWVESDYGKGTTFYFELPMEKILCQIES